MNKKIFYIMIVALMLFISSCSKKTYIVGFDTKGGTVIEDQEVKKNDLATKPNDPVKEGHTFIGWYVGKKEFDFNTKIENHLIIEAKWEENEYIVKFVTNTDQVIDDAKVKYNKKVSEPYTKQLANHQFLGWYLNDELFDFNNPITSNITLVAKWERNVFQVTFDAGFDYSIDSEKVNVNQNVEEPTIKREGYKFLGWYLNDELFDFNTPVTEDITLVAKWEVIQYIIRFNTNTEEEISNRYIDHGTYLTEPVLELEGFDFLGWFFKGELYDFSKPVTANATLYARFEMKDEKVLEEIKKVIPETTKSNLEFFENLDKCSAEFIWESSNEDVISSYGQVARFTTDKNVKIKVTVLYSDRQYEVELNVLVPKVELKKLEKGKIVSGYLADYGSFGGLSEKMIEQLDIINYSFGTISNGELKIPVSMNKELVLSYREKGVRIVLAIGGWGADGFSQAVRTEASRNKFIDSIMEIIKKYQFDGIDIDWEYPGSGAAGIEYHSSDRNNLTLFCQALKQKMQAYRSDLILSIAIAPSNSYYDLVQLNKCVDLFNLMTYDFAMGSYALHDSNLYSYAQSSSSMHNSVSIVKNYVDSDKIVPGAAFYTRRGYFESESNQKIGSKLSISMAKNPLTYKQLMEMIKSDPTIVESYDETAEAAYIIHKRWFYSYDNPRSILAKCDYIKQNKFGGLMCWDLTNDYIDENGYGVLVNSMYEGMK